MGLDMYLERHTYVGRYDTTAGDIRPKGRIEVEGIKTERVRSIVEEVGYWRKANHIHAWFIEHCAKGVDNCEPVYVSREQLQELLETVKRVLKKPKSAPEELPTQAGFFFGGTDYDEYYFDDLKRTKKVLESVLLEDNDSSDFYYRASW